MPLLHLLHPAPSASTDLMRCLNSLNEGDALLLIGDGVYAALPGALGEQPLRQLRQTKVYVLRPDLEARALAGWPLIPCFEPVDFDGFVDLVTAYDACVSWGPP